MGKKRKPYIPNPKFNPIVMSKKIEKLQEDLEHHQHLLLSTNKANDLHVEHLSNFVQHDMKNAIQGIDGIIYNTTAKGQLPVEIQEQFNTALDLLRSTLDNFTKLIPSSRNTFTTLPAIFNAVEMLSRSEMQNNKIECKFDYDRGSTIKITYSFQHLVQVLHNFIINAKNALEDIVDKKIYIQGSISDESCTIKVYDNGTPVDESKRSEIFKYGYSTTGGSGVGLFHANSVIKEMNGSIEYCDSDIEGYTKFFHIHFTPSPQNE